MASMGKRLERAIRRYREADPDGAAAEYLEDDAKNQAQFAEDCRGPHEDEERAGNMILSRQSAAGAALLQQVLRMRLPVDEGPI